MYRCLATDSNNYRNIMSFGHLESLLRCQEGDPPPVPTSATVRPNLNVCREGSIVRVDTKTFQERLKVIGTKFNLVYSSDKVAGFRSWYKIDIPLIRNYNPTPGFINISTKVKIAGREFSSLHPPATNLEHTFSWDGMDGNNIELKSSINADIELLRIMPPLESQPYFEPLTSVPVGTGLPWRTSIAGWSLDVHHYYDILRKTVYLGSGNTFEGSPISRDNGDIWVINENVGEVYVFDSNGRHKETKFSLTGGTKYLFSYLGSKLSTVQDAYGENTLINYVNNNPVSIIGPNGKTTILNTNVNGFLESIADPSGNTHFFTYSSDGLMLTHSKPTGVVNTMLYDSDGNMVSEVSSNGSSLELSFNKSFNVETIVETTALGRETTHVVTNNGKKYSRITTYPDTTTDLYEQTSEQELQEFADGRSINILEKVLDPRWGEYHKFPNNIIRRFHNQMSVSNITKDVQQSDTSNPFSIVSSVITESINSQNYVTNYNGVSKIFTFTTPEGRVRSLTVNNKEDAIALKTGSIQTVNIARDSSGRVNSISQTPSRYLNFDYNSSGLIQSVTNSLNLTTQYLYDANERIDTKILPDSREVHYTYDSEDNLTSIVPPGKTAHIYNYGTNGLIQNFVQPGTVTTSYTYDNDKKLSSITTADSQNISFFYGPGGHLESVTFPTGSRWFTYSGRNVTSELSEDAISRNLNGPAEALISEQVLVGSSVFSSEVGYEKTNFGSLNQFFLRIKDGEYFYTDFSYDDDNLLTVAGAESISRDLNGNIIETNVQNTKSTFSYSSNFGELASIEVKKGTTPLYKEVLLRDVLGRIIKKTEKLGSGADFVTDYIYDLSGRLYQVHEQGLLKNTYGYDSNSNRISQISGTVTLTGTYDSKDRLLTYGSKSFTYNLNGDVKTISESGVTSSLTYDIFGNLKSYINPSKNITYKVDSQNRRISKKLGSSIKNYFVWNDKGQLLAITNGSGVLQSRFIYGQLSHVPDYMVKGTVLYKIITDHLGSPVRVVNANTGALSQSVSYDEFGNILTDTSPGFTPFGFAGCLYDIDTKLCRFGARDYDASIGRWLSKDPILFAGGDTNLYGYVLQDPINYIDPTGNLAWAVGAAIVWGYFTDLFNVDPLNKSPDFNRQNKSYMDGRTDMIIPGDKKYNDFKFLKDANEIRPNPILNPLKNNIRRDLQLNPACG